ncbi:hypothetical protein E2562_036291 [Oryza meyeriana var. granulata]|uniref:Glutaredoxin domain-containing protein n=1 Tax=Oryza meyeriana var. granulata TaxID=110450 RepID=A0A6G1DUV4_9ORYZ|nr:hypothetical protein E2562_036291 [Oryza meyeriana var. granulata]
MFKERGENFSDFASGAQPDSREYVRPEERTDCGDIVKLAARAASEDAVRIPVVDISALDEGGTDDGRRACVEAVRAAAEAFFALPIAEKEKYANDPAAGRLQGKAVDELPPESPPREDHGATAAAAKKSEAQMFPGVVQARIILFQKEIDAKLAKKAPPPPPPESAWRVVVYLTSLRGIRQTYEDCCATSAILRGYGVRVDERDLSLHAGYKDKLRAALGGAGAVPGEHGRPHPQVFVDGRHLGGAEDVRRMHESGELTNTLLKACDTVAPAVAAVGKGGRQLASSDPCGGCGGVRFVPCDACSGSCKVFVADDEDGGCSGAGAFRRCPECNENGLVKCPVC